MRCEQHWMDGSRSIYVCCTWVTDGPPWTRAATGALAHLDHDLDSPNLTGVTHGGLSGRGAMPSNLGTHHYGVLVHNDPGLGSRYLPDMHPYAYGM